MQKYYRINISKGKAFIYSIDFHSPIEQIDEIIKDLTRIKFKGIVLFDMLLSEGRKSQDRFFSNDFDGFKFGEKFNIMDIHSFEMINRSHYFYKNHPSFIKNSFIVGKTFKNNLLDILGA